MSNPFSGMIDSLIDQMVLPFLNFSYHSIFPNYGLAIILLTIVLKIVFLPFTTKQYKSMQKNKELQPEIKKLQEKYKKDPQKLQAEMMKFWKEKGFNPLSGCLPALIQLPFFFAIFATMTSDTFKSILATSGINPGLFTFWVPNLAEKDATYILPILVAVTMYFTQKMMITDSKQASFFVFLPFLMFFFAMNLPSGAVLYWAVSQVISTIQQMMMMKATPSSESSDIIDVAATVKK